MKTIIGKKKQNKTMRSNYREVRMTSANSNQNPLLGHPKGFPHDPYPVTTFILTHNTWEDLVWQSS